MCCLPCKFVTWEHYLRSLAVNRLVHGEENTYSLGETHAIWVRRVPDDDVWADLTEIPGGGSGDGSKEVNLRVVEYV